ncbi:MAG TPA: ABC transporter permease [Dyadobacter sp.]|nr:ABC transporter permease [Dyadobacter sp.]
MLKNYFKIAFRNIWKNKVFSAINVVGLAIGMAACIIIMLFVFYEKSFDRMHSKNIYRLNEIQNYEGMVAPQKVALSMFPMGPTLKNDYPEVRNFVRINDKAAVVLGSGAKRVELEKGLYTDSNFFEMFDFKLIEGVRTEVLKNPNSVVLTENGAKRIFGDKNPIGQSIVKYAGDTLTFKVTGIMENVPENSHLQFDALFSFNTVIKPDFMERWGGNWLVTYLELAPDADVASLENKFPAYLKTYMKGDGWKSYELFLQPLTEIHSSSSDITHDYQNFHKFNKTYTYTFSVIAIIVLIIACVNFMNLSTARSAGRAREVGVRKSIGAHRAQLAYQFIGESIFLSLISFVLAVVLVKLFLPFVSEFSQRDLQFSIFSNPVILLISLAGAIAIGVFSGMYPALFLSAFEPVKVLKGKMGGGKSTFRNTLVIAQFSSAIFLIIATGFAVRQLNFMQQKDPGFVKDQVVVIPLDAKSSPKFQSMKQELLNSSLVQSVTGSGQRLGNNLHQTGVTFRGEGPVRDMASSQVVVDPDYLSLYQIKLVAGRNFTSEESENGRTYIINESLARELLKDQPVKTVASLIGKPFGFSGLDSLGTIVGVAKDFNFNSLHHKIETLCLFNQKDWGYHEMSVKIKGKDAKAAVAAIESVWKQQVPEHDFTYSFLDEHFAELYRADGQVSNIVGILAGLAILISCLGLFGLASFSAERRVKEIGVRKVMGASVAGIVALLSRDFMKLVFLSIVIAVPLAWVTVNWWLQDFAYRVEMQWWVFAGAGVMAIAIAQLTVSFQSIKAALTNPVKSLRAD